MVMADRWRLGSARFYVNAADCRTSYFALFMRVRYILSGIDRNHPAPGAILKSILQYLKTHGERLDTEIAAATGLTLANARAQLIDLAAKREIMVCYSTRYEKGKAIEGMKCRLAGFIPPAAPGRKPKTQLKLS
jgi:hypothetical protein